MRYRSLLLALAVTTLLISSCRRDKKVTIDPTPAANAARPWEHYRTVFSGNYQWGFYTLFSLNAAPIDSVRRADTSFPISMVNDSTLGIWNYKLSYSDSFYYALPNYGYLNDTAHALYYFDRAFFSPAHNNASIVFNRNTDSLFFTIETNSVGGKYKRIFFTKIP